MTTNNPAGELISSGAGSTEFSVTTNNPLLTASINGAGSSSLSVTTNTPILGAIANLTGESSYSIITNSPVILPLNDASPLRTATASFSITGSLERYALGYMIGTTDVATELTPASIAAEIWNAALVEYQLDGSAGKSLSTASSGGVDLNLMAQAILLTLQNNPLPVNMIQVKGQLLEGSGTEADPWGP